MIEMGIGATEKSTAADGWNARRYNHHHQPPRAMAGNAMALSVLHSVIL